MKLMAKNNDRTEINNRENEKLTAKNNDKIGIDNRGNGN
jgi:hypothetical protein